MIFAALFCRRRRPIFFLLCLDTFFRACAAFSPRARIWVLLHLLSGILLQYGRRRRKFLAFWMRFCIKNTFLSAIWRHFLHKTSSNPQNFPPAAGRNFFKPRNLKNFKTQCFSCSQDIGFSCSQLCLRICRGRSRTPADHILDYVRPYPLR